MFRLEKDYFVNENVVDLARDLIGKVLITNIEEKLTSGIITETEAYNGVIDKASHAYGGRRTSRTEIMFGEGGHAYVYLCYGIHHLFNIVTSVKNDPKAILIRAIRPLKGADEILKRRKSKELKPRLCTGPGKVAQALAITTEHSGLSLVKNKICLQDEGIKIPKSIIKTGPRIGIDYAEEDARLPYRFYVEGEF